MALQYIIVLLLFGSASIQSESVLPNGCPADFHIHRLLPHETDCGQYYQCSNGQRILMHCAPGTLFSEEMQVCVWPHQATCNPTTDRELPEKEEESKEESDQASETELTTIQEITEKYTTVVDDYLPNGCPKDFSIHLLLPHETECDKFYQCSNGIKYLMQCAAGTLFDNILQVCNWPYLVECPSTTTKPTTIVPVTEESTTTKLTPEEQDKETTVKLTTTEKYTTVEVAEQTTIGLTVTTLEESTTTVDPSNSTNPDGTTYNPDTTQDLTTTTPNSNSTNEDNITVTQSSIYTTLGYGTETQNSNYTTDEYITVTQSYNNTKEEDVTETQSSNLTTEGYTTVTQSSNYTTEGYATITESSNSTIEDNSTDGNIVTQYPDNSTTQEFITITEIPNSTTDEAIITTEAPICPTGVFGNVPHPNRCDAYYLCSGGIAFEVACAGGFEFDPVWRVCVEIAEGGCTLGSVTDNESENTNFTTTESPTSIKNITDTSVTQDDSNTSVQDFTTKPGNTELDEIKEETTTADLLTDYPGIHESTTLKYEPSITTEAPICPAGVFGNVPHPYRCDVYYLCSGGIAFEVACASGFEFDPVWKVCVEIAEGGCTLGSVTDIESENNTVTSTEFPTNTETITDATETQDESYTSDQDLTTKPGNAVTDEIKEETTTAELLTDYPGTQESTTLKYTTDGHLDEVTKDEIDVTNTDGVSNSNSSEVTDSWIPGNVTYETTQKFEHSTLEAITDEPQITTEFTTVTNEFTTAYNITEEEGSFTNNTMTPTPINPSTEGLTATTQSPNYNTTDESNTTTLEPICPVGVFGNVPHPDTCNAYFLCSGGIAFEIFCSEGFEFNEDLRECIKISEGGCTLGKVTTLGPNNSVSVEAENTTISDTTTEANTNNSATEGPWGSGNATTQDAYNSTSNTDGNVSTTKEYELTTQSSVNNVTLEETTTESAVTETSTLASTQKPNVTTHETTTDSSPETTEEDNTDIKEPICLPGVFGNVPHPHRCNAFYICSGGFSFEVFCSDGFEFDRELQECVEISPGGCTLGPITTEDNIIISSTKVTNRETTTELFTEVEQETNEATKITDAPWNVPAPILPLPVPPGTNPGINPEPPVYPEAVTDRDIDEATAVVDGDSIPDVTEPICPPGVFGNIPHQTRCDVYYLCSAGIAFEVLCPNGFEFDPNTKNCAEIAEGGCTLGTNNFLPKTPLYTRNFKNEYDKKDRKEICQGNMENMPHEEICSSFYKCVEGEMLQLFCNDGYEFEPRLKKCVPVTDTGCTAYKKLLLK